MLKILINNEEVVCDKQLEIKEEMLSTSSCILNNCYPKSWENTKDYTNQYYYPKDYSKCVIKDEVNVPAEEGEYATGINLNINVDNTKEWDYKTKGNIYQKEYNGINLMPNNKNSGTSKGITYTANEDGTYLLSGQNTTTSNSAFYIYRGDLFINSGTYYVIPTGDSNVTITLYVTYEDNSKKYKDISTNSTITINKNVVRAEIYLQVRKESTKNYNKFKVYPMLSTTPVTKEDYEPYVGGSISPSPDYPQDIKVVTGEQNVEIVGKNLFDKDNPNIFNGYPDHGALVSWSSHRILWIPCNSNTTYTVKKINQGSNKRFGLMTTIEEPAAGVPYASLVRGNNENNLTITTGENAKYLLIWCYVTNDTQTTWQQILDSIQIEQGTTATEYQPYQSQNYLIDLGSIELCKIENYQDYIYNQNGEWYIHKETGKYLINTSQITLKSSYTNIEYASIPKASDYVGYGAFGHNFVYCNKAVSGEPTGGWNNLNNINKLFSGAERYNWWLGFEKGTGLDNIKALLTNLVIIYPLATSTNIKITDTTLIQQLDNLKNATLFNGVNNISVEGNLPAILNLHYNFVTARIDTTLLFSGVVKNTGNINLNPRYPHYCNLEVLDFKTFLSECDQLDFVINNKTITEAIEQVTQAVASYGFVVGNININDNTIIGAYSTQEKTPYDVFQYLADISQSRWYTRLIDENTVAIDFYDPTAMQRGVDLDFSNNEFACQNNVEDLSFNYGTYDYRNKQIMLSNQVFGGVDFEETIIADGYNKIFNTTTPIGILKGITVSGSSVTFATNEDKAMGVEADFYYTPGNAQIESNENGGTYPANTIIIVGYTPLVKGRQVISDTTEIGRIATQTGRNGTISRYEKRNDVLSSDELELIGSSYLKYKGTPEINLTLVTKDVDLYNIGQIVYFNYPNIQDLSKDYMVKSKKTRIINTATDWNIWYSYTLTSNFNSENAINYFDNQRAKASGNIQVGDYITRNVDIENSCMIIFNNPTATEITIADNNILNAPLNAPFTQ